MKTYTLFLVILISMYLTVDAELKIGISKQENFKIFANINNESTEFTTKVGPKQGCVFGPILFLIILHDAIEKV